MTDATRRERFLRDRQNARYDALVESAPDAILNVDSEGIIRLANPAAARQFGYSADELVGQSTAASLFEHENAWLDDLAIRERRHRVCASRPRCGFASRTARCATSKSLPHVGRTARAPFVTAILRDVNDRRDAELALRESERQSRENAKALAELNEILQESSNKLSAMDRRKDEFLATLAHELRNPLAPLRNGLQLLKLAKDDAGLLERTRHMMDLQLGQMVRLIDDLLDVGRISNDRIDLNKENTSLDKVIRQAIETSSPLIDAQQHKLTIELPAREIVLDADVVRLTQVFANLLNNAAKYTPRNGSISVKAEQHGDAVIVRVIDNGIGIPPELLPRVFDMFMQVDKSLERAQGGLGYRAVARQALGRDAWRHRRGAQQGPGSWAASSSCACRPRRLRPPSELRVPSESTTRRARRSATGSSSSTTTRMRRRALRCCSA